MGRVYVVLVSGNGTRFVYEKRRENKMENETTPQKRFTVGNPATVQDVNRPGGLTDANQRVDRQGRLQVKDANGKWVNPEGLGKCPTCLRDFANTGGVLGKDGKPIIVDAKTGLRTGEDIHGNRYDDKGVHPVNVDREGRSLVRDGSGTWVRRDADDVVVPA
jgi:hypothetical protein